MYKCGFFSIIIFLSVFLNLGYQNDVCPKLIWILVRGLHPSKIKLLNMNTIYNFKETGATINKFKPGYLTNFVVNEWTQATGRFPKNHKIFGEEMLKEEGDDILDEFTVNNEDPIWWNKDGKNHPIWTVNDKYSDDRLSGVIEWSGVNSIHSNKKKFDYAKIREKVSTAIYDGNIYKAFQALKKNKYNFIMLSTDILVPKNSKYATEALKLQYLKLDKSFSFLLRKIKKMGCKSKTNILLTSDHGYKHIKVEDNYVFNITDHVPSSKVIKSGASWFITPKNIKDIENIKSDLIKNLKNKAYVYTSDEISKLYQFGGSNRIPALAIIPKCGVNIIEHIEQKSAIYQDGYISEECEEMDATFIVNGPNIVTGKHFITAKDIDVYNFVCTILEVETECGDNDGSNVLRDNIYIPESVLLEKEKKRIIIISVSVSAVILVIICSIIGFKIYLIKNKKLSTDNNQL